MIRFVSLAFFLVISVVTTKCAIEETCLKCICKIGGCEYNIGQCNDIYGTCGPYRITESYWIDCYRPGEDWQTCTKQMECSETCVKAYMKRYGADCTGGREPSCKEYSKIHYWGPGGCQKPDNYFSDLVEKCLDN